jgi:hypothetical protein
MEMMLVEISGRQADQLWLNASVLDVPSVILQIQSTERKQNLIIVIFVLKISVGDVINN